MTTERIYRCNLCRFDIRPSTDAERDGLGIYFTGPKTSKFTPVHDSEYHICHPCARNVHDELRRVTPAAQPAGEGEK